MSARLPVVSSDNGTWGTILNTYLEVAHTTDGNLKGTATAGQFLKSSGASASAWSALASGEVTTALGYTPLSLAGGTLTGKLNVGSGSAQQMYTATTAQDVAIQRGTLIAPDTLLQPLVKIERVIETSGVVGDGGEQGAALLAIAVGTTLTASLPVGLYGAARTTSESVVANMADSLGVYGVGRITGSGVGSGIGAFFVGRRDNDTGKATGMEVNVANYGTLAGAYNTAGSSTLKAVWINVTGNEDAGAGIQFGNGFGRQFAVGIGFNGQVAGGKTGGVRDASIRDDSQSATSFLIKGTHATAAMAIGAGSGPLLIGHETAILASTLLEISSSTGGTPIVQIGSTTDAQAYSLRLRNSLGQHNLFVSATTNGFLTGTISGDAGFAASSTNKAFHLGGTSSVVKVTQANTLGFFNVTPVVRQTVAAAATDAATTQTLANNIRTALINLGLAQ